MKKIIIISLLLSLLFLIGCEKNLDSESKSLSEISSNVTTEAQKQLINLMAKGGFEPTDTVAKSGVESILRVETRGTFDCSSSLVIPSLDYTTNLPPTGVTDVKIPPQEAGATLSGSCSMGMYSFEIKFI